MVPILATYNKIISYQIVGLVKLHIIIFFRLLIEVKLG